MTMVLGANSCLMLGVSYLIQNGLFDLEVSVGMILDLFFRIADALYIKMEVTRSNFVHNVKNIGNRKRIG